MCKPEKCAQGAGISLGSSGPFRLLLPSEAGAAVQGEAGQSPAPATGRGLLGRQVKYDCMQDKLDNFILIFLSNKDTVGVLQFSMIRRDL